VAWLSAAVTLAMLLAAGFSRSKVPAVASNRGRKQ
jgi:hypothetical protein